MARRLRVRSLVVLTTIALLFRLPPSLLPESPLPGGIEAASLSALLAVYSTGRSTTWVPCHYGRLCQVLPVFVWTGIRAGRRRIAGDRATSGGRREAIGARSDVFDRTVSAIDQLQDGEPSRTRWIERIFHPIPSSGGAPAGVARKRSGHRVARGTAGAVSLVAMNGAAGPRGALQFRQTGSVGISPGRLSETEAAKHKLQRTGAELHGCDR